MTRLLTLLLSFNVLNAIGQEFTLADTLRGANSEHRTCYDVTFYDLDVSVNIQEKSLAGSNTIHFNVINEFDSLQIDLFDNMVIDSIICQDQSLTFNRVHNAVFVRFSIAPSIGMLSSFTVYYHGTPTAAKNAPWDGGFVWKEDSNGKPFIGVACEGTGASLWWPNKDHLSDEPDSMRISCTVPEGLMCVSNGDLMKQEKLGIATKYTWQVDYPINNYNVTLNIADYAHHQSTYEGVSGELPLDYYVLKENLDQAKEHFKQVPEMLGCFEEAFGPYPFYEDGYALVETPYLGMEHQSAIAYGNKFMAGYLGRYPGEMDFDYIVIHETGHEWWGNSVSMKDVADMWIHESFCTYSEAVYVECKYGYESMLEYLVYQRNFINNRSPIYGTYGLNHEGNGTDMYYKGSWMLHTFRSVLDNDSLFKSILKGIAQDFSYITSDGEEIIEYINTKDRYNYTPFFNQYLKFADVPILEYRLNKKTLELRWKAEANGFKMPVIFNAGDDFDKRVLVSNSDWTEVLFTKKQFKELSFRDDLMLFLTKNVSN